MTTTPSSARPVVDTLLATLEQESAVLGTLGDALGVQLAALRGREHDALQTGAERTSEAVAELDRLRLVRERQTRLLGRVLGLETDDAALLPLADALAPHDAEQASRLRTLRDDVRARAETADAQSQELAFALNVAVRLGRQMLQAWQHVEAPLPSQHYTAAGRTTPTPPRPFVNHLG
jgi:hypothetical protein